MALSKTTTSVHGLVSQNAYHRVEDTTITKTKLRFCVRSYADVTKPAFVGEYYECAYSLYGENPIRQAYLYLKTLPEWADAVDA